MVIWVGFYAYVRTNERGLFIIKKKLIKIGLSAVILLKIAMPTFAAGHVLTSIEPIGNIPIIVPYMKYTARASANLIIVQKAMPQQQHQLMAIRGLQTK